MSGVMTYPAYMSDQATGHGLWDLAARLSPKNSIIIRLFLYVCLCSSGGKQGVKETLSVVDLDSARPLGVREWSTPLS